MPEIELLPKSTKMSHCLCTIGDKNITQSTIAQSAGGVEYTDDTSAEG